MDEIQRKRIQKEIKRLKPSPVIEQIKYMKAAKGEKIEYVILDVGSGCKFNPFEVDSDKKEEK